MVEASKAVSQAKKGTGGIIEKGGTHLNLSPTAIVTTLRRLSSIHHFLDRMPWMVLILSHTQGEANP